MALTFTKVADIPRIVASCRTAFDKGAVREIAKRKDAIRKVIKMVDENEAALLEAVKKDLRKSAFETKLMELAMVRNEAYECLDGVDGWIHEKVPLEGIQHLDSCYVRRDPLGVVLIIGAWNYPLQLTLVGLCGALAAGNTVVLKPSEVSPHTAGVLATLIPKYLPPELCAVVNGGVAETTAVLKERFDHILYTGNSRVAKIVMRAASEHLTPVTLELGGKSPCIVDANADLSITARRIMWGRFTNCGQTCIAPDYLLVHESVKKPLIEQLRIAREAFLGKDPQKCVDYGRMVNDMHWQRVVDLMKGGQVVVGGEHDKADKFIAPTVLDNVDLASPLMTDEIFGPLLPIVTFRTASDVVTFVNQREKPLALYVFSTNSQFVNHVIDNTSSGAATVNDTLMHAAVAGLPFGGVGYSGMGAYHGHHTFQTFSHRKAVMKRQLGLEFVNVLRYPPYTERKYSILSALLMKSGETNKTLRTLLWFTVAAAVVAVAARYTGAWSR